MRKDQKNSGIWIYPSFRAFSREAMGEKYEGIKEIKLGETASFRLSGPPVIVATLGALPKEFPVLEGRFRQTLPQAPGKIRGTLSAGCISEGDERSCDELEAWLAPWRAGADRILIITICPDPKTVLKIDVSDWPERSSNECDNANAGRLRILRRAACVLDMVPDAFSAQPSIGVAYERLEEIWSDQRYGDADPLGELLVTQAKRLKGTLDDLGARPRSVLSTEHRMLKLQDARRIDAKTLRWLSAQPGKSAAERAGGRQRIKAPKRYETISTLENQVLRAFAALTIREAENWLVSRQKGEPNFTIIQAHQLRARQIEATLRARKVPKAIAPVKPNFPLRFDPRYRNIWRAWQDLRARSAATELEWMWQHRTFMELLGLRAAMKLREKGFDILAHSPMLREKDAPSKGRYLRGGIQCTFGESGSDSTKFLRYESNGNQNRLGAIAEMEPGAGIWWDAIDSSERMNADVAVGELPWIPEHEWDARLSEWAAQIAS